MILLNGGGPLPARTSMNDSEGSLTFAHWLGVSYSVWLMVLLVGSIGFESKGQFLLPARRKALQQWCVSDILDMGFPWIWCS